MFCSNCGAPAGQEAVCRNCGTYRMAPTWHHPQPRYEPVFDYPVYAPPPPPRPKSGGIWIAVGAIAVLMLAGTGVGAFLLVRDRESADDRYLAALDERGVADQFSSDANAIAAGKRFCRTLEEGGKPQGMPADQVAVDIYCPQFAEGFHVLEIATITGTFTLIDDDPNLYNPAIATAGSSCSGSSGYSDIDAGTQVEVKNGAGDILVTTQLGDGSGTSYQCTFPFSFEITEGEDRYVISVTRRGEISYSFTQLKDDGVTLSLGG